MKRKSVLSIVLLTVMVSAPALAQQATEAKPEFGAVPQFKIVSASFVREAKGAFGRSWSNENPERTGLVVVVEASFPNEFIVKPTSFFIQYSLGRGSSFDEDCFGITSLTEGKPGEWSIVTPDSSGFLIYGKTEPGKSPSFALLFSASKKIKEFSLIYRHPAASAKGVVSK